MAALVDVFREVRRVLRDDGTLWLNIGDSYCSTDKWGGGKSGNTGKHTTNGDDVPSWAVRKRSAPIPGVKPKDLLGIPWLLAFALRADGWYLRSDVIWAKPNPMPESVTDRPTSAHEHVFLLAKSRSYFYDADAIREPNAEGSSGWLKSPTQVKVHGNGETSQVPNGVQRVGALDSGRNKRNVWEIATQPYANAHFATFPPKLVEPCILAGSSPKACGECGAPWERVVEVESRPNWHGTGKQKHDGTYYRENIGGGVGNDRRDRRDIGWQPSCACHRQHCVSCTNPENGDLDMRCCDCTGAEPIYETLPGVKSGVVLDPFAGAGTTGVVALRKDRSFIGIELNPAYAEMARERIRQDAPLLNTFAEIAA